jgi:hypothetical protein
MLWNRILDAMGSGSSGRASDDSVKYVLKRRLSSLEPADHFRYVEIESRRLVETLRVTRDIYRVYLQEEGRKPVAEMYWVVFRFAVIPYAVKLLREAAAAYVISTQVPESKWQKLYGHWWPEILPIPAELKQFTRPPLSIQEGITNLITEESLQEIIIGGPFGRDGQMHVAASSPGFAFRMGEMSMVDIINLRRKLWEKCYPFTEGLSRLFDATQEELFCQSEGLSEDGRRAEAEFASLTPFQKIAHNHLIDIRRKGVSSRNLGRDAWLELLRELDAHKVTLENELHGKARHVLEEARRNSYEIRLWEHCYDPKVRVSLDDGKIYSLRREVTHAIHNVAKKAQYHLGKVWKTK